MQVKSPSGKRIEAENLRGVLENFTDGVLIVDKESRVWFWNGFIERHSGISTAQAQGRTLAELFPGLDKSWLEEVLAGVFQSGTKHFSHWRTHPHVLPFRDPLARSTGGEGGEMMQNCTFQPVFDAAGEVKYVCLVVMDVTASALYQLQLSESLLKVEELSRLDGLTGIFNRKYWEQRLEEEFQRCKRYPGEGSMTLLLFDLDDFKLVNDRYGHLAGDEVLRQVAIRAAEVFRNIDILGRYGGEEFGVILPRTDLNGSLLVGERLRKSVAEKDFKVDGKSIDLTLSVGVAPYEEGIVDYDVLINRADSALYQAKESGRNQVLPFDPAGHVAGTGT